MRMGGIQKALVMSVIRKRVWRVGERCDRMVAFGVSWIAYSGIERARK